jgi:hypothetical protein
VGVAVSCAYCALLSGSWIRRRRGMAGIFEKAAEEDGTASTSALLLILGYHVAYACGTRSLIFGQPRLKEAARLRAFPNFPGEVASPIRRAIRF